MKKYLLPALLFCAASAFAQTTGYTLNILLKNGDKVQYNVADIDRLTFDGQEEETPVGDPAVKIQIPTDFSTGWVQKVMLGDKQVAEVDKEYIKSIDKQVVVIYPMGADGRADLTKGMTSTGASVVWDLDKNTAKVGAQGDALTAVYVVNGAVVASCDTDAEETTLAADLINDKRGLFDNNTYKIVKIGTQYWMAENLRATCFLDGTSIASISSGDSSAWKANTTGAYLASSEYDWIQVAGRLYNGYCVTSSKGIAPEGWEVPSTEQLKKLRSAGNLLNANFKASDFGMWSTGMTGNNITGFDAIATGTYLNSDLTGIYSDTYLWGSTVSTSWLRVEGLCTLRINGDNSKSVIVSGADDCHQYGYGHAIRCVRK